MRADLEQSESAAMDVAAASRVQRTAAPAATTKMRILSLAREFPFFPGGHGGNTRAFCLLRELARTHDVTVVTNVCAPRHVEAVEVLKRHTENLFYYRDPAASAASDHGAPAQPSPGRGARGGAIAALRTLRNTATALPGEARLWGREGYENIRPAVEQALRAGPYDLLQIEYSENADWVREVPFVGPKVLVVADVKSVVWWRRFCAAPTLRARLAAFAEMLRFLRFERRACGQFDLLVAMSESDREHLRRLTGHPNILVIPNGVDLGYFQSPVDAPIADRVVFTATMDHPPNLDGILFFVREVWPLVRAARPAATLDIVGANPPAAVRSLAGESIRVTGFVPDTRPYLAAATVFICPLRFASGTRLKILEAMAMGKAVVSTTVGAEGIACKHGRDILLADDPGEMAACVVDILRDGSRAAALGSAARAVAAAYSWPQIAGELDRGYAELRKSFAARRRARPPRIALNGYFLVPGGTTGGIADYVHHLAQNLLKLDRDTRYLLLASPANVLEFGRLHADNLEKQVIRQPSLAPAVAGVARDLVARALRVAPPPRRRPRAPLVDADLVHCFPGYIDDFVSHLPCLLTVADIQHEFYPEFFSPEELLARRAVFAPSIELARRVVAISEFTRRTLIEKLAVPAGKIEVIHLGVDARFFAPRDAAAVAALRRRYGLPEAYCVYPANLWPHKNHPRLLDALAAIPAQRRPHLVLTGSATRTRTAVREEIRRRSLDEHVHWLGYVDERDLHPLFAAARMMIFPSLFEGFGMPVVEAMAAGCPVACSATTALPEIVGDAARLFDPTSVDAIRDALEELWRDAELRKRLCAAGRERARLYSWRDTALRTRRLYARLLDEIYGAAPPGEAA